MPSRKPPQAFGPQITRRDFLNGVALGVGGALLGPAAPARAESAAGFAIPRPSLGPDWYGYGGVGDYRLSHGNTPEVVAAAHRLRDGELPVDPGSLGEPERFDLVIVGCGIAGLGAAFEFTKRRKPGQTCLMLDNHPVFGGEAKENEFDVGGVRLLGPQGANGFFVPEAVVDPEKAAGDPRWYAELGVPREFTLRDWPAERKPLRFPGDNYEYLVPGMEQLSSVGQLFRRAGGDGGPDWAVDMFARRLENTPLPAASRKALLDWHAAGAARRFASDEEAVRRLDVLSYEQFLTQELGLGPEGARHADLFLASALGLGSDAVSAYAAWHLPLPGLSNPPPPGLRRCSFPGGNSGFARYFVKRLVPDAIAGGERFEDIVTGRIRFGALDRPGEPVRMRVGSTALSVEHEGSAGEAGSVRVVYERGGRLHALRAKAVVMATGGWMNRHVVRDLPEDYREAYAQFVHAPMLIANVALTNWRFLYELGITAAVWDRDEEGFGFTCNIRNPMQVGDYRPPLDPDAPMILSFYTPFHRPGLPPRAQVAQGRAELLNTTFPEYERRILAQMTKLFGAAGFDPERDVAGLILNRWGHAYSVPFPGFFGGATGRAPREVILRNHGRIAFGHSELDGWQHWGTAADQGRRAFLRLADAL